MNMTKIFYRITDKTNLLEFVLITISLKPAGVGEYKLSKLYTLDNQFIGDGDFIVSKYDLIIAKEILPEYQKITDTKIDFENIKVDEQKEFDYYEYLSNGMIAISRGLIKERTI
jgi:hypothetical protein